MTTQRYVADCRKYPSESKCSLLVAGTEDELMGVLVDHAVTVHKHQRGPQLIQDLKKSLEKEPPAEVAKGTNREIATAVYDAFNRRDFAMLESFAGANATITNIATGEVFRGPKGFRTFCENWVRAFPDARVELGRVLTGDDGYVAEFTGTGTHKGALVGPAGTVQPTGRRMTLRFIDSIQVRDGKITEARTYFDALSMLSQLGLAPGAQPAAVEQAQPTAPEHRH